MKHVFRRRLSTAVALLVGIGSLSLSAADVSGKWAWTIETPDGNQFKSVMTATQEKDQLKGHLTSPASDDKLEILKGKVTGSKVSFTVKPNFNGNIITVEYDGTLKGDKIDGSLRVVDFDAELAWNAKRMAENVDPSGNWDWTLETPNGNTMQATLELEYKNDKLIGELIADNFSLEIEKGTIKGDKITFVTSNPNNGQTYESKGTIKGSRISGTVSFETDSGESRTLEWSAKKQ